MQKAMFRCLNVLLLVTCVAGLKPALAQTGLQKVNHIIIVMQENHSFDNYFGALAYAPGTPITRRTAIADVDQTTMRAWMDCLALRTHRAGSIASIRI